MRFAFTDDQVAFRDTVRDFLAAECPASFVRAEATSRGDGWRGLWSKLAEMGVVGLTAPEARGGLGLGPLDLVLILEETGRAAMPGPIVETTAVALPLLGDDERAERIACGDETVAVALDGGEDVAFGADADWLVAADREGLWFVARDGVQAEEVESVDGLRRLADVEWERASVERFGGPPGIASARDHAAAATAAQLCGVAARLIELAVEYAKERHQFGVPIGSFQAVKHHCADALLRLEYARPVVYRAAYSLQHGDPERSVHASMAKAYASDAARLAARVALQVHGAIGYTAEHDLQLWMKRAWSLSVAWGDAAAHRAAVADAVLGRR